MDNEAILALLEETREFPPSAEFTAQANLNSPEMVRRGNEDPDGFWADSANELQWFQKWDRVLDWNPPDAKWFVGGKINLSVNCVDRHLAGARRNKAAIIWEGEPGEERVLTYWDLHREVNKFANVMKGLGIGKGDRVTLYMPMIPELPIAMLACARIGAPHSVVFGGFSAEALRERINDCEAKLLITADGGYRRGNIVPLKKACDEAVIGCPTIEKMVVVRRVGETTAITMHQGRDLWWHDLMKDVDDYCEPEPMDSEDPLYILYTSGSTGKPKGILHTSAGYLVGVYATTKFIFDIKEHDLFWCTADIGWVTGHSYVVYGPLANGASVLMYEGAPDAPSRDRFWAVIEKYGVTVFYTAPTAIRSFMRWGDEHPAKHDLSSLRLLGSVGEPINPEAWIWYHHHIGGGRCPIVDTWWQTETGMILITPLPGIVATKPGSATIPFPTIEADVVDETGKSVPLGGGGYLIIRNPWPAMLRTIYGDHNRYVSTYWMRFPGVYFTGDGAKRDKDGYFWLLGRVDDVMNVAGHRVSTMEVESALVEHPAVAEAAVIGRSDEIKGQAIAAFVILRDDYPGGRPSADELKQYVTQKIGAICRPDDVLITADLPKTRSGKIMRRLLRDIAEKRVLGDTTTLADPAVVAALKEKYGENEG
ncbi:MAG: acetate--CoA ligase [Armatimonadetes bacterium]|nr:acetate--CoA ligase [Armatimonadota bacterium]